MAILYIDGANHFIQKIAPPYVQTLIIIHLFGADFSSCLKYMLGRKILYHIESHDINKYQTYWSRPGQNENNAKLTTSWVNGIYRLKNQVVRIFNDATRCYEQSRTGINTVTLQRMRCPSKTAVFLGKTQQYETLYSYRVWYIHIILSGLKGIEYGSLGKR